jgi:V/A-type H+-transporting ATPase subunit I
MLQPVPMVHMQIQVPNREAAAVTRHIAAQGLLHLIDIAHGRVAGADAAPAGTREQLAAFRDLAQRIRRTAERLDVPLLEPAGALPSAELGDFDLDRKEIETALQAIESQVDALWHARETARDRADTLRATLASVERLSAAGIDVSRVKGLRYATVALGLMRPDELPSLAAVLAPAPFALVPLDSSGATVLTAAAVPASLRERLDAALRVVAFERISLDDLPEESGGAARRALAESEQAQGDAAARLEALGAGSRQALIDLGQRADVATLLLQAQTHFAAAGRFVVISGWIPESDAADMARAITAVTAGRAIVDIQKPQDFPEAFAEALRIPILHRNPVFLRPFQMLVQMYGVPAYTELQPTAFFAISFLLMFGVMFGDAGQGLVLFSAGYCLWRWVPRFLDYGVLLMECGAASTLFGVLYGSFFGIEGLLPVLWMEPIRDLPRFMTMAIGFGVLLVSGGLALNIINSWRAGDRASALVGPRGVSGAFMYWVSLALLARALMPQDIVLPGWVLLSMMAVPVVLLVLRRPIVKLFERGQPRAAAAHTPAWLGALEGSVELVDTLFSYFANTISFVRVAAFAAVHAGVFIAMFALADTLASLRFGQPLSIATLVIGNVIMILLEGLTVSVQVLRLEYYEFFGKFFKGGGELYRPLMLRKGGR